MFDTFQVNSGTRSVQCTLDRLNKLFVDGHSLAELSVTAGPARRPHPGCQSHEAKPWEVAEHDTPTIPNSMTAW